MCSFTEEDGPAVVLTDEPNSIKTHPGKKEWWVKKRHREDGPAVELPVGYKEWWVNGIRHREDGPLLFNLLQGRGSRRNGT